MLGVASGHTLLTHWNLTILTVEIQNFLGMLLAIEDGLASSGCLPTGTIRTTPTAAKVDIEWVGSCFLPDGYQAVIRRLTLFLMSLGAELTEVALTVLAATAGYFRPNTQVTVGLGLENATLQVNEMLCVHVLRQPLNAFTREFCHFCANRAVDGIRLLFLSFLEARGLEAAGTETVKAREHAGVLIAFHANPTLQVLTLGISFKAV